MPEDEEDAAEEEWVAADLNEKLRCLRKMVGHGDAPGLEVAGGDSPISPNTTGGSTSGFSLFSARKSKAFFR